VRSRRVAGHWAQSREGSGVTGKLHLDVGSVRADRFHHATSVDHLFMPTTFAM
jgi:hypothetical protein